MMRRLFRLLGLRLARQLPELVALYGRAALKRAFVAEFRLDALAAELPGRAYVAATV